MTYNVSSGTLSLYTTTVRNAHFDVNQSSLLGPICAELVQQQLALQTYVNLQRCDRQTTATSQLHSAGVDAICTTLLVRATNDKEREKENLVDRKMFKSNIHHKTRQSPLKTRNTGG